MMKPHVHKDVIIAWANGAEIEVQRDDGAWESIGTSFPHWLKSLSYRVKPVREYPTTSLTEENVYELYFRGGDAAIHGDALIRIANAAIKQYIIDQENNTSR